MSVEVFLVADGPICTEIVKFFGSGDHHNFPFPPSPSPSDVPIGYLLHLFDSIFLRTVLRLSQECIVTITFPYSPMNRRIQLSLKHGRIFPIGICSSPKRNIEWIIEQAKLVQDFLEQVNPQIKALEGNSQ